MKTVYIVTGPPCSGKTTYTREHMGPLDAVVDLDEIENALCYGNDHSEKAHLVRMALALKAAALNFINNNAAATPAAYWVINTAPAEWVAKRLFGVRVEVVEMPAAERDCLARLAADDTRPDKRVWEKAITEYFDEQKRREWRRK